MGGARFCPGVESRLNRGGRCAHLTALDYQDIIVLDRGRKVQPRCTMTDGGRGRKAVFQIAVERREGPVLRSWAKASMHRAEIDQVAVTGEICLIPDLMFPETTLPNAFFAPRDLSWAAVCWHRHGA